MSDFSESASLAIQRINKIDDLEGAPSYQNAFEIARKQIQSNVPSYAEKEILVINSSITINDPNDIFETIEHLATDGIKVSVVSLSAAIQILMNIAKKTQGNFFLAKDKDHFIEILDKF